MLGFASDQFLVLVIAVSVSGGILGVSWRPAAYALAAGGLRWFVWPALQIGLAQAVRDMPVWILILGGLFLFLFGWFAMIKLLQGVLSSVYGRYVSGRLISAALIATFRSIGRIMGWVLFLP